MITINTMLIASILILIYSMYNSYVTWKEGKDIIKLLKDLVEENQTKSKILSEQIETLKDIIDE